MSHLFWLDQERLNRIKHMFPKPRGVARADDLKVISGIIHVIRNGLRWRDAPSDYGPHKTLYNRWARWSQMGVFARILTELAAQGQTTGALGSGPIKFQIAECRQADLGCSTGQGPSCGRSHR